MGRGPLPMASLMVASARAWNAEAVAWARGDGLGEGRRAVVHQRDALAVLLSLYLALRRSEIVGLQPRDVRRGELWYRRAKQRKGTNKIERLRVPAVVAGLPEPYAASCMEQGMERLFPYSGRDGSGPRQAAL